MRWLRTKLRNVATRGIVNTSWPPRFSVHGAMYSASLLSSAARERPDELSNRCRTSALDDNATRLGGPPARSNDDSFKIVLPHSGRLEMCVASSPSAIDFG